MSTGVALLLCMFIMYCTGSGKAFAAQLFAESGWIAATCLLLSALSSFDVRILPVISCNFSSVLLLTICILLCGLQGEVHVSILLAFLSGILGWFLLRLFPDFFEPAVLIALPAVVLSQLLPTGMRHKLLCVSAAPIFFGLTASLEDWYLFDKIEIFLGNTMQHNAQIFGAVMLLGTAGMRLHRTKKAFDAQKEY